MLAAGRAAPLRRGARARRHQAPSPHSPPLPPDRAAAAAPARAAVNVPSNCALNTTLAGVTFTARDLAVAGSFTLRNPTAAPLAVTSRPVVAVVSTVPAGSGWAPPTPEGAMYGKLRLFRPWNGPFDRQMSILEYPVPACLEGASDAKPAVIAPGKSVSCAFRTPAAAVRGVDARTLAVSVSFSVGGGGGGGVCAADAPKVAAA